MEGSGIQNLKTTTENPGIDIKGKPGSPIRTVLGGVVTTITYIRGYGTTIIIDHGGGFYTVYSHVANIQTNVDSQVRNGDVIAYMGDSGSINGSKLHFEIWGKGQKTEPRRMADKKIISNITFCSTQDMESISKKFIYLNKLGMHIFFLDLLVVGKKV